MKKILCLTIILSVVFGGCSSVEVTAAKTKSLTTKPDKILVETVATNGRNMPDRFTEDFLQRLGFEFASRGIQLTIKENDEGYAGYKFSGSVKVFYTHNLFENSADVTVFFDTFEKETGRIVLKIRGDSSPRKFHNARWSNEIASQIADAFLNEFNSKLGESDENH